MAVTAVGTRGNIARGVTGGEGAGCGVKVVSERLGHASATITLGIYAHVMPGMQAAAKFGALMAGGAS